MRRRQFDGAAPTQTIADALGMLDILRAYEDEPA
jgi:hypothetical protein